MILIEPMDFDLYYTSDVLSEVTGLRKMDLALLALQMLGPEQSLNPAQKRLREAIFRGEALPRSLIARFQKKLLEDSEGAGILTDFPLNVEEATMLKDWGHKVTACIVVHVDVRTVAERRWFDDHEFARYEELPSSLEEEVDFAEIQEEIRQYEEDILPLVEFYRDVYVPIRATYPPSVYTAHLKQKFGFK